MNDRARALVLRRRERQLRGMQVRLDADCERIRRLADANVRLSETVNGLLRVLGVVTEAAVARPQGVSFGEARAHARDGGETPGHAERTCRLALMLARRLGMRAADLEHLRMAALVHDVGQSLARDFGQSLGGQAEAGHAERACLLLETTSLPAEVIETIRFHHDRWDGVGNPSGLAGDDIPRLARVLAVADAFDGLVHGGEAHEVEVEAWETESHGSGAMEPCDAADILVATAGRVHDPAIVQELCELLTSDADAGGGGGGDRGGGSGDRRRAGIAGRKMAGATS